MVDINTIECPICCLNYNKSKRIKITCNNYIDNKNVCNYSCCRLCMITYFKTSNINIPHCMCCKKKWSYDFLINNFTQKWIKEDYKNMRKIVLFEIEKSKMIHDQDTAKRYKNIPNLKKENKELHNQIRLLYDKIDYNEFMIRHGRNMTEPNDRRSKNKPKKTFIRKCIMPDCNGFLSTKWKCSLCDINVCNNCFEIKNNNHICDKKVLENIQLIIKDTKPCPSCGEMIHKIDGCDQMWCPLCKSAWSWRSGIIVTGKIHNPHYYEYQRQINNGEIPRDIDDIVCGGLPRWNYYRHKIEDKYILNNIEIIYRNILHFQDIYILPLRRDIDYLNNNKRLRVYFMLGEIEEIYFKNELIKKDRQLNKNISILQVYELYNNIIIENLINMYNKPDNIINYIHLSHEVRRYSNKLLADISIKYNLTTKYINEDFELQSIKYSKTLYNEKFG